MQGVIPVTGDPLTDLAARLIESGIVGIVAYLFFRLWQSERADRIKSESEYKKLLLHLAQVPTREDGSIDLFETRPRPPDGLTEVLTRRTSEIKKPA
jgi:hypothetical protein